MNKSVLWKVPLALFFVFYFWAMGYGVIVELPRNRAIQAEQRRDSAERACAGHGGWQHIKVQKVGFSSYEPRAYCADGYWTAIP